MGKARILLFTGEGKGKTTAGLGMVLRSCGHGLQSLVIQFVKADATTGEIEACRHLPGVRIIQTGKGFVPDKTNPDFPKHCAAAEAGLDMANTALSSGKHDLVVLDEICTAIAKGLLDENAVIQAIIKTAPATCVVMTGRDATQALTSIADTVTDMRLVKHGLDEGITAQKGVEY